MNIQQRLTRLEAIAPSVRTREQSEIDYLNEMIDDNENCPSTRTWLEIDAGRLLNPVDIVLIAYGLGERFDNQGSHIDGQ